MTSKKMPTIVMIGDGLLYSDWLKKFPDEKDKFSSWMRYKDTWIFEQCDALGIDTDDYHDALFRSLEDYMIFWGSEYLDECVGSIHARRYKDFTKEDEEFYQELVENADEEKEKSQIRILKPDKKWNLMRIKEISSEMENKWWGEERNK